MKASNLGIIFGPSLLRSKKSEEDPMVALADNSVQSKAVEQMIQNFEEIFELATQIFGTFFFQIV